MYHQTEIHIARLRFLAIIVPLLFMVTLLPGQDRIKAPVKLKIEDGDFESVSVVLKNNSTGESFSMPGVAKFDLDLNMNADYIISFSKPGYITKRIAFNTTAPPVRTRQGFYPFNFEVNLFRQYDGVNIVVFNQPVGKISYNRLIDDFDYDTDYTKQIQSALKQAEEEIKKKQAEEKALAETRKKEEEKKKQEEAAAARAALKAKQEADKKAAEEARLLAIEEQKQKKLEEEQRRLQAKATMEEEQRKQAVAKIEEEERARLKAAEETEARKTLNAGSGNDTQAVKKQATSGDDSRKTATSGTGNDAFSAGSGSGEGSGTAKGTLSKGENEESASIRDAEAIKKQDTGISKAKGTIGDDNRLNANLLQSASKTSQLSAEYEKLPGISVEEIVEPNRTITRVTVRNAGKESIFSKVVYSWGGVFYFRSALSISEHYYKSATGLK